MNDAYFFENRGRESCSYSTGAIEERTFLARPSLISGIIFFFLNQQLAGLGSSCLNSIFSIPLGQSLLLGFALISFAVSAAFTPFSAFLGGGEIVHSLVGSRRVGNNCITYSPMNQSRSELFNFNAMIKNFFFFFLKNSNP